VQARNGLPTSGSPTAQKERAFALVLVVSLLALLVLLAYALSALSRIDSQMAGTAVFQTQARQNALLGLQIALGDLQRHAGPDERITGMAGITGLSNTAHGANNSARHWCGVWSATGGHLAWLSSGAIGAVIPPLTGTDAVTIVAAGSLGAESTDREHVRVLRRSVNVSDFETGMKSQGNYAFWVGDEGIKLSAVIPAADSPINGAVHAIGEVATALSPTAIGIEKALTYEQLDMLPGVGRGDLQMVFHSIGRTHFRQMSQAAGVLRQAGMLNINSTSARYWREVAGTYNFLAPPAERFTSSTNFGNRMQANFLTGTAPGKSPNGPFLHVDGFLSSTTLSVALVGSTVSLLEFRDTMSPWLTTRSDTFRVRAYGDALNPADATRVESTAYCEAIVQRTAEALPGHGRRFVITYFRWLGPDDI